jgi:hypothetical protein
MVNAKNITLAALATTVVVAVVGVEVYNSGTYKTQVSYHGAGIASAQTYAESTQGCGDLSGSSKGQNMNACMENNKRTEMKMELDSGIVVAMINDDVSLFTRTASGLVHVTDGSASEIRMVGLSETRSTAEEEIMGDVNVTKNGDVVDFGTGVKIVIDEIAANPTPLDFTEERAASKRSLLATREGRQTFRYNRSWWKSMHKHWKKVKKKHKCMLKIIQIWWYFHTCLVAVVTTTFTWGLAGALIIWQCGMFLVSIYGATQHCGSDRSVPNPPTPSAMANIPSS